MCRTLAILPCGRPISAKKGRPSPRIPTIIIANQESMSRGQISAGKISITLVLIVTLVFGIWFYSGWPQIWQKPPIPPEVQEVQADTANKYFYFDSSAEGWSATAGPSTSMTCSKKPWIFQNNLSAKNLKTSKRN